MTRHATNSSIVPRLLSSNVEEPWPLVTFQVLGERDLQNQEGNDAT